MSKRAVSVAVVLTAFSMTALWLFFRSDVIDTPAPEAQGEGSTAAIASDTPAPTTVEDEPGLLAANTRGEAGDSYREKDAPLCPDYSGANDKRLDVDEVAAGMQSATSDLLASVNPEHQLAAALMLARDEPEKSFELLEAATERGAAPEVAMWRLLILCGQRDIAACNSEDIEARAINADPANGMMWIQIAGRRLQQGQEELALEAMRQAISAPRYDTYFTEQIALFDRGLAAVSGLSYTQRMLYSNEFIAESPSNFEHIGSRCGIDDNGVWAELCDQLGRRLMTENVDTESKKRGANLRRAVLENTGDSAALTALESEIRQLDSDTKSFLEDERILNLLLNDEAVLRDFLTNTEMYGEQEGMRRLADEVQRLQNTPGYDQCNFRGNPFIRF